MLMCHKNVFSNYVVLDNLGDLHVNESDMEMEEFVMRMKHQLLWIFAPFIWTKKDITSWPWCWIPNSRSCGFPLLMWVVCNLSFGGYLWQVVVITFVGGMLQVFDAYYVWWTSKSSCNEQWRFVFSHQHFETCPIGAWLILLVSCWWKEP
jgi:hypothetical protein